MHVIPKSSSNAALRRVPFRLVDSIDAKSPKVIGTADDAPVTGQKVKLSIGGAAFADSTNDVHRVSGALGQYYVELTASEAQTVGFVIVRLDLPDTEPLEKYVTIGPVASYDEPATAIAIVDNGLTAASLAADAVAEIQSGLAAQAATAVLQAAGSTPINATLSAAERDAVADAYLDRPNAVMTGMTPRKHARLMALTAGVVGESSGAAGTAGPETIQFLNPAGTVVLSVPTDQFGNRTDAATVSTSALEGAGW